MLVRCFLWNQAVPLADLPPIIGDLGVEALHDEGLLAVDGALAHSLVRLTPFGGLLFAHDAEDGGPFSSDHVTGIGPAPKTLHALTIRQPVARALDIGTGCGVQALFLARHAGTVVATDVNARALWLARCNAALNGIENVEWREGSLFDPVASETFDLIVANPPFVQSPDTTLVFRDGGTFGNICETLIAEAPRHLTPCGFAQALIS